MIGRPLRPHPLGVVALPILPTLTARSVRAMPGGVGETDAFLADGLAPEFAGGGGF